MNNRNSDPFDNSRRVWTIKSLVAAAILLWLLVGFTPFLLAIIPSPIPRLGNKILHVPVSTTGQVGDTFGLANSLFSALSVAGVAHALILQSGEQATARRQAAEDRKRFVESEKKSAELAILAALIHARSTAIASKTDDMEDIHALRREFVEDHDVHSATEMFNFARKAADEKKFHMQQLYALMIHAEILSDRVNKKKIT